MAAPSATKPLVRLQRLAGQLLGTRCLNFRSVFHGPLPCSSGEEAGTLISSFLSAPAGFAVVGASPDRSKVGNQVLRCYFQHGNAVVPVSLSQTEIEGLPCVASLRELPGNAKDYGVSIITPPTATLAVLEAAKELGIQRLWLQPGAESAEVLGHAAALGLELVHSGPCVLKVLGFDKQWEPPVALAFGSLADGAVRWRIDDRYVMTLTLANPRKRNPLTHSVLLALHELLELARGGEQDRVRAVVLESEGPVFSSGHDFADFAEVKGKESHAATLSLCSSVNVLLQRLPQPTLAAVQGLATAGGCQLACSCDLVVAAAEAAFQLPGTADGGFCHTPAVAVASRAATPRQALELALLAERVPAARAAEIGLVNRVVRSAHLKGEVRRMAENIARVSPQNLQQGKQTFYQQISKTTLEERYAVAEPVMLDMFASTVYQEKMHKFLTSRGKGKQ